MKAAWYEQKGPAEKVLRVGETDTPHPTQGQVRVRIHASGLNQSDTKSRSGWDGNMAMPYARIIPHQDGAGIIDEVGENVATSRLGERVWVYEAQRNQAFGTAAEYTVIGAEKAVKLPQGTSFAEGACLGVPAMTAHRCLFQDGPIRGQTLLIAGGTGGVGYYAVQLAKRAGATVIATIGADSQKQLVAEAGADFVINYKTENVITKVRAITGKQTGGVDRIVEVAFGPNLPLDIELLNSNGVCSTYASDALQDPVLPFYPVQAKDITIHFVFVYLMPEVAHSDAATEITASLADGTLKHIISRRFSLGEIVAAHELVEDGQVKGKVVIDMDPEASVRKGLTATGASDDGT